MAARLLVALLLSIACLAGSTGRAAAAGQPLIPSSWVTDVTATSANLHALINANGLSTTYRFEYIGDTAYQANLAAEPPRDGFFGAAKAPPGGASGIGSGTTNFEAIQHITGLAPLAVYHYRPVATNSAGTTLGPAHTLGAEAATSVFSLPDGRGWEMVSPVDKNGGAIQGFGASFGGGVFQAAVPGGLSPTARPPPSAPARRARRAPASTSRVAAPAAGRRRTSPRRCSRAPTATGPTASPTSSSRPISPGRWSERPALPRLRRRMPGRQPAAAGERRASGLRELLPARQRRRDVRSAAARNRPRRTRAGPRGVRAELRRRHPRPRPRRPLQLRRAHPRRDRSPGPRRLRRLPRTSTRGAAASSR